MPSRRMSWRHTRCHLAAKIATDFSLSRNAGDAGSLTRKGSLDRKDKRSSWASSSTLGAAAGSEVAGQAPADIGCLLDSFPPVTLTVSSFFKQVKSFIIALNCVGPSLSRHYSMWLVHRTTIQTGHISKKTAQALCKIIWHQCWCLRFKKLRSEELRNKKFDDWSEKEWQ
jgi:hypothetical protein